ncbi:MAG: YbaN family protein, partial [Bacteroidales bacterium]|nr:YbaN family protein [Bacteroidales bacterium]
MKKTLFINLGVVCVALATIGIVTPVLPTTPFLLLATYLFAKSSPKMHERLLKNKVFGKYLENYFENKPIPIKQKIYAILFLWLGLGATFYFATPQNWVFALLIFIGIAVTLHIATLGKYNRMMKRLYLPIILMFAMFFASAQSVIFVKTDGTGDGSSWDHASSLEHAMDIARSLSGVETEIWVQHGIYFPTATIRVPAGVWMYGGFAGDEEFLHQRRFSEYRTIIDGQKTFTVIRLESGAVLDGFALINGHAHREILPDTLPYGGGVWMEAHARVENCYVLDNSASKWGGGIFAEGDGLVYNTLLSGNTAGEEGLAIYGTTLDVRNVTVS